MKDHPPFFDIYVSRNYSATTSNLKVPLISL